MLSLGFPHLMLCLSVCVGVTLFKESASSPVMSVLIMKGPAAGAEDFPLNGQATVAVMVTKEVERRGWRSTSGCCRCTRCEAVLATLLALSVAAAAVGCILFRQVRNDSFAPTGRGRARGGSC